MAIDTRKSFIGLELKGKLAGYNSGKYIKNAKCNINVLKIITVRHKRASGKPY